MSTRLGVDIGGTFTDLVLETNGNQYSTKLLTTHNAPENAMFEGMYSVCTKANINPKNIEQVIHGTTLATNALIEKRGAKTALITTKGFRDVIEMRTENRFEQYDLNLVLPPPLLPRNRRYVVNERMDVKGQVLIPLADDEIESLIEKLSLAKYESIAIGLLHSYVNDLHEKKLRDVISKHLPNIMISLSCEISPQMREYERFNTTVANAYIKPLMKNYLSRLQIRMLDEGIHCPIFLMHSGGGVISLENASNFPVRLIESGPAGGAVFASHIAAKHQLNKVLSFDMGGTTAKICLIKNHTPKTSRVFEAARTWRFKKGSGMPISIPVIDMVEIGAGGGSLAHVDALNQIRVGPESAGSEPGPACYGRGGEQPSVTDADLILGKLDSKNFAGGSIQLQPKNAEQSLKICLGEKLQMDAEEAAWALIEVVDENMANAARVHAVENGEDLSDYTMIAFGGAAPLHAGRLCEKLGIDKYLVPSGAGVGSAIGFLRAPYSFETNRSVFMPLSSFDPISVKKIFVEMEEESIRFVKGCDPKTKILTDYKVYMRYSGQGWETMIEISYDQAHNPDRKTYIQLFEEQYSKLFGQPVIGMEIEIIVWSVNAYTASPPIETVPDVIKTQVIKSQQSRSFFDTALGQRLNAHVYQRQHLNIGDSLDGPALICEDETTTIVPTSRTAQKMADECLYIKKLDNSQ